MDNMFHDEEETHWANGLDDFQDLYEAPQQFSFGYSGIAMPADTSIQSYQSDNHVSAGNGPSVISSHHHNVDYSAPILRETDGPDPSSRPRLTTEQTNILESKFQIDPKPPTDTKKELAQNIGLTLDKVNNWYQNRRAKAKNAKKIVETFGVLPVNESSNAWQYPEYPSTFPSQQFTTTSSSASVMNSMTVPSAGEVNGGMRHGERGGFVQSQQILAPQEFAIAQQLGPMDFQDQSENQYLSYVAPFSPQSWTPQANLQALGPVNLQLLSDFRRMQEEGNRTAIEVMQRTNKPHSLPFPSEISALGASHQSPAKMPSPSPSSSLMNEQDKEQENLAFQEFENMNPANFHPSPPDTNQMLLQQDARPQLDHAYSPDYVTPLHSQDNNIYQSPDSTSFVSAPQSSQRNASRRGSDSSELASNFNTIRLQKAQSQQTSDEEVFKTPQIPHMNLAARRKRRPAALGNVGMRSQSLNAPDNASPSAKTATIGSASSVRRIKSTGNSLNVIGGRVTKPGIASAQRSPLTFSTFQEAEAMNHINAYAAPSPSMSQSTSTNGQVPMTPHTPSATEHPTLDWGKSLAHSSSNPNMFQHQQFQSSPYQNHAASPPVTPYMQFPVYAHSNHHTMAPPQSAPAHLTHFPNFSPPFQAMPGTPSGGYFPPQPVQREPFHYQPGSQMIPTQHGPVYDYQPVYGYQPHIVNNSPPFGHHPGMYAMPPQQPAKELEVSFVTFPEATDSSLAPKEPHRPKQFTFQNSGPADF